MTRTIIEGSTQAFCSVAPTRRFRAVTTNVVFRYNYLTRPLAWRDPILAAPPNVTAAATPGAGLLPAGTYFYKVVARKPSYRNNNAVSVASAEVMATLDANGAVTISWTPVATAQEYLVYGRTSNSPTMFWTTPDPFFTDTGEAGAAGKPGSGTKWMVKNSFELKNAQDVLVEGNVFENVWVADQPGYPILFTPRNQNAHAPWVVVQNVVFRNNRAPYRRRREHPRHRQRGTEPADEPHHRREQPVPDLTASIRGTAKVFLIGDGPDNVTIDQHDHQHPILDLLPLRRSLDSTRRSRTLTITNNMSAHTRSVSLAIVSRQVSRVRCPCWGGRLTPHGFSAATCWPEVPQNHMPPCRVTVSTISFRPSPTGRATSWIMLQATITATHHIQERRRCWSRITP